MNIWGEAAEGRPSLPKSFQNMYGILRESLGTFVQSLGKLWEILSECLWNPLTRCHQIRRDHTERISGNCWGISGESLGNPFRILLELLGNLWAKSEGSFQNTYGILRESPRTFVQSRDLGRPMRFYRISMDWHLLSALCSTHVQQDAVNTTALGVELLVSRYGIIGSSLLPKLGRVFVNWHPPVSHSLSIDVPHLACCCCCCVPVGQCRRLCSSCISSSHSKA